MTATVTTRIALVAAAALFLLPLAATAQQQIGQQQPAGTPPAGVSPAKPDWGIRLGAGAIYQPDYEGSDDYEANPLPLVMVSYRDLVFLRFNTLGANLFTWQGPRESDKLQVGPLVRYQFGRDEGDNKDLRGMGDIDPGIDVGVFLTYRTGPWSAGVTLFRDASDAYDGGMTARFAGGYMHAFSPQLRLRSEIFTTWADDSYMESFFGVTAVQSARSGIRQYRPEGGMKDVGLQLDLDYSLTQSWGLTGRLGYKRMLGDAADSPLVEDRGSANQLSTGLFLTYKF